MNEDEFQQKGRIDSLLQKKPYLALLAHSGLEDGNKEALFQLQPARNGVAIPAIRKADGSYRFLASPRDPMQEASRMLPADLDRWRGREIVLILGMGNPSILETILPHLAENQVTIAIDAFFELGQLLLVHPAVLRYLERPGSHLFCGEEMMIHLRTYLESIPSDRITGVRLIRHSPSLALATTYYEEVETLTKEIIQAKLSDMMTRFEFERQWLGSIMVNARFFPLRKTIDENRALPVDLTPHIGALQGVPGCIVSAGPSLVESLDLLRQLKSKAFLLCTDTALKLLLSRNIRPHGVITLDAQLHSLRHYQGEDLSDITLFADIVVHPDLLHRLNFRNVVFTTTEKSLIDSSGAVHRETTPGTSFIEKYYGPIAGVQSGGSVATTAFDLLRLLGVNSIFFIGQDLAYTGRKIHATGTHHIHGWLPTLHRLRTLENINERVIQKRKVSYQNGLSSQRVLTDYVLDLYNQWFRDAMGTVDFPVYNLSAKGAIIPGSKRPDNISSFIDSLPTNVSSGDFLLQHPPLQIHTREEDGKLLTSLKAAIQKSNSASLLEEYPELETTARRARIYVARNETRLTPERALQVEKDYILRDLKRILRFILRYRKKD